MTMKNFAILKCIFNWKFNSLNLFLSFLFIFFCSCSNPNHKNGILLLNGEWEYTEKFSFDNPKEKVIWEKVEFPLGFNGIPKLKHFSGRVAAKRKLPKEVLEFINMGIPMSLDLGQVSDVVTVYINNHKIFQVGSEDPYRTGIYKRLIADIPFQYLHTNSDNEILITFFSDSVMPIGAYGPDIILGKSRLVYDRFYKNEMLLFAFLVVYLAVGLYHLLLSVKRPKELYNLYFGLFSISFAILGFFYSGSRDLVFVNELLLRMKIQHMILFNISTFLLFFFSQLFYEKHSKFGFFSAILSILLTIVDAIGSYEIMQYMLYSWYVLALVIVVYLIFYIVRETLKKNKDAYYLLVGVIILMLGVVNDILWNENIIRSFKVTDYAFFLFVIGIAGTLANRFVRIHNQVEELNESLERKVEERTNELQTTLKTVSDLKDIQDGDYFLISLLIEPLGGNYSNSESVSIDYLISQKKKFHFKKWDSEIGGDLVVASSIQLGGKPYTVFLNGDAMGKSIQGAGGAIVLGTVFKAVLTRTQYSDSGINKFPERWLKECFLELQNIFVSFDGSMLVSSVIGLIDDSSGLLYYINAEHPSLVLYRDGKAEFLDSNLEIFRKIGIGGIEGKLVVRTFQLQNGDILISGSDGRDDILLGLDLDGGRVINDDENLFLRSVEVGDGDLNRIKEQLLSNGELTDDLSLVRIEFKISRNDILNQTGQDNLFSNLEEKYQTGEKDSILSEMDKTLIDFPENLHYLKSYAIFCLKEKKYKRGAELCERYIELSPTNIEFIYLLSYALKKCNQLAYAADMGERCRLRDPRMIKNFNLADIHRLNKNLSRAIKIINEVLAQDPKNEQALGLLEKIHGQNQ
jgi:hypothetical protein